MTQQEFEKILSDNKLSFYTEDSDGNTFYIIPTDNLIEVWSFVNENNNKIIYGLRDKQSKNFIIKSHNINYNQSHIEYIIQNNIKELVNAKFSSCPKCKSILSQYNSLDNAYNFYSCLNCDYISASPNVFQDVCREKDDSKMLLAKKILSHSKLRFNKFAQSLLTQLNAGRKLSSNQLAYVIGDISPKGYPTFQRQVDLYGFTTVKEKVSNEELQYIVKKRRKEIEHSYRIQKPIQENKDISIIATNRYKYIKYPFKEFNPIQSLVFNSYKNSNNIVLASPTSSGKTICAEIVMGYVLSKGKKVIYISPLKALSNEKYRDWTNKDHTFSKYKIAILTGDFRNTKAEELQEANIICMTSEMLDSKTRKMESENNKWLLDIRAVIVDEAHLITSGYENNEDGAYLRTRGDKLEAGLMRFTKVNSKAKIMLLSATMPNVSELCNWLTILNKKETELIYSTWRPTRLDVHYVPYQHSSFYRSKINKKEKVMELILNYLNDKFIVFVHSKSEGKYLKKELSEEGIDCDFHSANLTLKERTKIEDLFRQKNLRVLIATSTIAYGCFTKNTKITMWDGTIKNINKIVMNDEIKTISKEGKIEKGKVSNINTKKINVKLKIKTTFGHTIYCSEDHPFYIINNKQMNLKIAKKLQIGNWIPMPNKYDFKNKKFNIKLNQLAELLGLIFGDGYFLLKRQYDKNKRTFKKRLKTYSVGITFDKKDSFIGVRFKNLIKGISGYDIKPYKKDVNGIMQSTTGAYCVTKLIEPFIKPGRKNNLNIPNFCFKNKQYLKSFLQGLFDTDGCMSHHLNDHYSIELSNTNETLINDVQHALLFFGIKSKIYLKQPSSRKYKNKLIQSKKILYRLIINGYNICLFYKHIGFKLKRKQAILKYFATTYKNRSNRYSSDLIPFGSRIKKYKDEKNINWQILKNMSIDLWSVKKFKKNLTRKTLYRLKAYGQSKYQLINFLFSNNIAWCQIKSIDIIKTDETMYDLTVCNNSNYIANNILVHNCNLPARRVIVFGWHRGMKEVCELDIVQEIGRAGRFGLDDKGDAYILTPERRINEFREKIENIRDIESCLNNHYNLAFHITAEIANGEIIDLKSCKRWFERSLAYLQNKELNNKVLEDIIDKLLSMKIIKQKDGKFFINQLGLISSWMYFNPYDVHAWYNNFNKLFAKKITSDIAVSWALTHNTSYSLPYIPKETATEVSIYSDRIKELGFPVDCQFNVYGAVIYAMLRGTNEKRLDMFVRQIKYDCDRIFQTLQLIKSKCFCKWNNEKLKIWNLRIKYGIEKHLVELVKIKGIGKIKAEKLYNQGVRNRQDYEKYLEKKKK